MAPGVFMRHLIIALCCALALAPWGARADGIGVVLVHGKQGLPDAPHLAYLSQEIEKAGFLLDKPTMCWSRQRIFDRTLPDCLADIDAAIARLKSRGATEFVIAGHSLGGVGAILYGSLHDGLKGVIALAPAPPPGVVRRPEVATSLQRAQTLIAGGHGDEVQSFTDSNTGPRGVVTIEVNATPKVFLSFYDMSGPANLVTNTARLKAPVLWVSGTRDPSQLAREVAFAQAPARPLNRYLQIDAGHIDTPEAATSAVIAWLKELAKS
jgi:pimeloyl-ACP methyl ester carboxylesterase